MGLDSKLSNSSSRTCSTKTLPKLRLWLNCEASKLGPVQSLILVLLFLAKQRPFGFKCHLRLREQLKWTLFGVSFSSFVFLFNAVFCICVKARHWETKWNWIFERKCHRRKSKKVETEKDYWGKEEWRKVAKWGCNCC